MLLCCGVLLMSGCAAALIPAAGAGASMLFSNKKPQELPSKTNAKVTSNILFTYDKNEVTDWNAENDTVVMDANIIKKFYDVNELLSKVRNAPNSLRLELQEQNWIGVDGQVTERVETVYGDGKPRFKDEKTWAGIFEFSDGINEVYLIVNEYSKAYFLKKKTGKFIDLFCVTNTAEIASNNSYLNSKRLTLNCWPVSQETNIPALENPDKK